MRQKSIGSYTDLGPPDLCYLEIEEFKKTKVLKKVEQVPGSRRGFYHYAYGVDTSSSACVAAYLTDCINQHNGGQGS